jgi:hypothetical protein
MRIEITDPDDMARGKQHAVKFTRALPWDGASTDVIHLTDEELRQLYDMTAVRLVNVMMKHCASGLEQE